MKPTDRNASMKALAARRMAEDPDIFRKLGALGGSKGAKDGVIKGFAANNDLARRAGAIGGMVSRRKARDA